MLIGCRCRPSANNLESVRRIPHAVGGDLQQSERGRQIRNPEFARRGPAHAALLPDRLPIAVQITSTGPVRNLPRVPAD